MEMNYLVVLLVTVVSFVISSIWFGPLFGKMWMSIHSLTQEDMDAEKAYLWKYLILEFVTTFMFMLTLAFFVKQSPWYYEMAIAFFIWIWIVLPHTISSVLWGADAKDQMVRKICVSSAHGLIVLLVAAFIYSMWL